MAIIDEMALGNGLWDEERRGIKDRTATRKLTFATQEVDGI